MPPAGRNPQHIEDLGFVKPLWWAVVASSVSKSSTIEDLGFSEPLWRIVVASSGSKSSKNEGLGFVKPLWRAFGVHTFFLALVNFLFAPVEEFLGNFYTGATPLRVVWV